MAGIASPRTTHDEDVASMIAPRVWYDNMPGVVGNRSTYSTRTSVRYEPMDSGVWIGAGENEDDIIELHPNPQLDAQNFLERLLAGKPIRKVDEGTEQLLTNALKTARNEVEQERDKAKQAIVDKLDDLAKLIKLL